MSLDHSLTYRQFALKNIVHRLRLRKILQILDANLSGRNIKSFADYGCSNGYLTALISKRYGIPETHGFDSTPRFIASATRDYPNIAWHLTDMNEDKPTRYYSLVTCFETLEHVGNIKNALALTLGSVDPENGMGLVTVPIEIGWLGTAKFLAKIVIYHYDLEELKGVSKYDYFRTLLSQRRISAYREPRKGWGTHFGFDYRDVDDFFKESGVCCQTFNSGTTRFYVVGGSVRNRS